MNSGLIGIEMLRFQLRASVLAVFLQFLEFFQQVVGLFALSAIVQWPVAQFGWEGLLRRKTVRIPDYFQGSLPIIEQIEAALGGERG
ncbi:MAG: hypothetical protein NT140_01145 [Deltaproteobacteria bacterium]|nr:hypothetical protein [Deltaproteobacteria bacterium]